jgi:hypothetical protein
MLFRRWRFRCQKNSPSPTRAVPRTASTTATAIVPFEESPPSEAGAGADDVVGSVRDAEAVGNDVDAYVVVVELSCNVSKVIDGPWRLTYLWPLKLVENDLIELEDDDWVPDDIAKRPLKVYVHSRGTIRSQIARKKLSFPSKTPDGIHSNVPSFSVDSVATVSCRFKPRRKAILLCLPVMFTYAVSA